MNKLVCSIKRMYPQWYMAYVELGAKKAFGFGTTHYKAFEDALQSVQKAKF